MSGAVVSLINDTLGAFRGYSRAIQYRTGNHPITSPPGHSTQNKSSRNPTVYYSDRNTDMAWKDWVMFSLRAAELEGIVPLCCLCITLTLWSDKAGRCFHTLPHTCTEKSQKDHTSSLSLALSLHPFLLWFAHSALTHEILYQNMFNLFCPFLYKLKRARQKLPLTFKHKAL